MQDSNLGYFMLIVLYLTQSRQTWKENVCTKLVILSISRLNSGNFEIFSPDGFYSNLNSWVNLALKVIKNDTDIAYEI